MSRDNDNSLSFGIGILAGVIAGVITGVLYAPKSGEQTRKELKNIADNFVNDVPNEVKVAKETSLEMIDKVKVKVEKQFNRAHDVLKANKMAAAKKKEEAESGIEY